MDDLALKRLFETGSLLEAWSRVLVCVRKMIIRVCPKSLPRGTQQGRWKTARSGR